MRAFSAVAELLVYCPFAERRYEPRLLQTQEFWHGAPMPRFTGTLSVPAIAPTVVSVFGQHRY